jgi:hypothetical protein
MVRLVAEVSANQTSRYMCKYISKLKAAKAATLTRPVLIEDVLHFVGAASATQQAKGGNQVKARLGKRSQRALKGRSPADAGRGRAPDG